MTKPAEQWVGAYYPETILEPRSKAILCLLFDKVICHFPVADMVCAGGQGMSEFLNDDPLVKAEVLEIREEFLLPDIEVKFSPGFFWGTDEEFNQFAQLQVTAMALNSCVDTGAVPLTDNPDWPIPASMTKKIDVLRFARLQAVALGMQSLEIALPPIANLSDDDILQARDDLMEQLIPFRHSMLKLAPTVRDGIQSEVSLSEIYKEARYVVETKVAPSLFELQDRLSKEKGRFWRRLILRSSVFIPKFIVSWTTKGALSAAVNSLSEAKDLAVAFIEHERLLTSLKSEGGLGYLLSVSDNLSTKSKKRRAPWQRQLVRTRSSAKS
ncbi:MAG: hypothetical protein NTV59_01475 [Chloroflexi bacterium]|nr:hypothetical protein [Chloroflexota bacterium]